MERFKFDWENPAIIKKNKEDGHTIAFFYNNEADALERKEPESKMTLNGMWKFHWQRGLDNCPEDFMSNDFDASAWNEIKVPSVWQMGQETGSYPYYYASTYCRALSRKKSKIPSIDHKMQEIGLYIRDFDMPENFDGQQIFMHFGATKSAIFQSTADIPLTENTTAETVSTIKVRSNGLNSSDAFRFAVL